MGYKPQERTVHLGTGSNASDFPVKANDSDGNGARPDRSAPAFRPRTEKKSELSGSTNAGTEPSKKP
jgi:hypothetical protein